MKITGHQLTSTINSWKSRRDIAIKTFDFSFSEENKIENPANIAEFILNCNNAIARIKTILATYNFSVNINLNNNSITLFEITKRFNESKKLIKLWESAVSLCEPSSYSNEDEQKIMTYQQANEGLFTSLRLHDMLKTIIANANSTEIEIADIDESLFQ